MTINPDTIPREVEIALTFLVRAAKAEIPALSDTAADGAERIILKEVLHLQDMVVRRRKPWWQRWWGR